MVCHCHIVNSNLIVILCTCTIAWIVCSYSTQCLNSKAQYTTDILVVVYRKLSYIVIQLQWIKMLIFAYGIVLLLVVAVDTEGDDESCTGKWTACALIINNKSVYSVIAWVACMSVATIYSSVHSSYKGELISLLTIHNQLNNINDSSNIDQGISNITW